MTLVDIASLAKTDSRLVRSLLQIQKIYYEPATEDYQRGRDILAKYPDAELVKIESHSRIPELNGNEAAVSKWTR